MKIAIVGGSGFVGSNLIREINNLEVQNLDKNPSPFFNSITEIADIRIKDQIIFSKNTKCVVLLAAEHKDDVSPTSLYYDVNVHGTQNVLNAMDTYGIKNLIFTSSVAVYGLNKNNPNENFNPDPFNHYGKSKFEAEMVIKKWYEKNPEHKTVTIIRPTVIFGERNRGNVYNLLKQISSGKFIMIGNGLNKKSMAYVGNVVAFIKTRLNLVEPGYNVFNYVDKPDFSMNELVSITEKKLSLKILKVRIPFCLGMLGGYVFDLIAKIFGKNFLISSVRVKKFTASTQFDSSKTSKIFKPPYSLKEGLDKTLEYEFLKSSNDDIIFYSE